MKPIGWIRTPFPDNFAIPRQGSLASAAKGTIQLDSQAMGPAALEGLAPEQNIWILFLFHKSKLNRSLKISPPRFPNKKLGVFATRSPHRPNPVGMTLARIEEIKREKLQIVVSGVDMIDNSPVIDIKPFLNYADQLKPEINPWPQPKKSISVKWEDSAKKDLKHFQLGSNFADLITQRLQWDPRPNIQKKRKDVYYVRQDQWDIEVKFENDCVSIQYIREWNDKPSSKTSL